MENSAGKYSISDEHLQTASIGAASSCASTTAVHETFISDSDSIHSPGQGRVFERDPSGRFERSNELLGRGAHKEVYRAYDCENGVEVAWNQLAVGSISPRTVERILDEIAILQTLDCPNIISFYASWATIGAGSSTVVLSSNTGSSRTESSNGTLHSFRPPFSSISSSGSNSLSSQKTLSGCSGSIAEESKIVFVTELMTSGTLRSFVKKAAGPLRLKVIKNWTRQILTGLEYLHSRDPPIIHRDLKCDNVFINGNNGQAKIGDLGLAIMKKNERDNVATVIGTPEFMAPELYDESYDEKVDIYAFGMCVLELVTKEYPYAECENPAQIFRKVTNGIKPAAFGKIADDSLRLFIADCIQKDPTLRPSACDLLQHPFFSQSSSSLLADSSISAVFKPATSCDSAHVVKEKVAATKPLYSDQSEHQKEDQACRSLPALSTSHLGDFAQRSVTAEDFISVEVASFKFPIVNLDMRIWRGNASSSATTSSGPSSPLISRSIRPQASASPTVTSPSLAQSSPLQQQHIKFPMNIEEEGPEEIVTEMLRLNVIHPTAAPAAIHEIHCAIENFLRLYCAAATAANVSNASKAPSALCPAARPPEDSGYEPDVEESPSKPASLLPADAGLLQWDFLRHQLKDNFDSCCTTYATLSRAESENAAFPQKGSFSPSDCNTILYYSELFSASFFPSKLPFDRAIRSEPNCQSSLENSAFEQKQSSVCRKPKHPDASANFSACPPLTAIHDSSISAPSNCFSPSVFSQSPSAVSAAPPAPISSASYTIQQLAHKELQEFAMSAASCSSASPSLNSPSLNTTPPNVCFPETPALCDADFVADTLQLDSFKSLSTPDLCLIDFEDKCPASAATSSLQHRPENSSFEHFQVSVSGETTASLPAMLDLLALDDIPSPEGANFDAASAQEMAPHPPKTFYAHSYDEAAFSMPPAALVDVPAAALMYQGKNSSDLLNNIFTDSSVSSSQISSNGTVRIHKASLSSANSHSDENEKPSVVTTPSSNAYHCADGSNSLLVDL